MFNRPTQTELSHASGLHYYCMAPWRFLLIRTAVHYLQTGNNWRGTITRQGVSPIKNQTLNYEWAFDLISCDALTENGGATFKGVFFCCLKGAVFETTIPTWLFWENGEGVCRNSLWGGGHWFHTNAWTFEAEIPVYIPCFPFPAQVRPDQSNWALFMSLPCQIRLI